MAESFFDRMKRDAGEWLGEIGEAAKAAPPIRELFSAALEDGTAALNQATDPDTLGERLRAEIEALYVVDKAESHARVSGVADRLNRLREGRDLLPIVIWSSTPNAAAAPGRYLYLSKALEQHLRTDAHVAFVVAHEMAHVDLGHLHLATMARRVGARAEMEYEADAHGLQLCLEAGFDRDECLEVFGILEKLQLDRGDLDGVFGNLTDPGGAEWATELTEWWRQRVTGYAPPRDRAQRLRHRA